MDVHNKEQRRRNMAAIKGKGTNPERLVAALLGELGIDAEEHPNDLPGKPDFVLRGRRIAIFVHGCFWHQHSCKYGRVSPSTNPEFWKKKISSNVTRDRRNYRNLRAQGWSVVTIWECRLRDLDRVKRRLQALLRT